MNCFSPRLLLLKAQGLPALAKEPHVRKHLVLQLRCHDLPARPGEVVAQQPRLVVLGLVRPLVLPNKSRNGGLAPMKTVLTAACIAQPKRKTTRKMRAGNQFEQCSLTHGLRGTLPYYCSSVMKLGQYLQAMYWFASLGSYPVARKERSLKAKAWRRFLARLRAMLWLFFAKDAAVTRLGGPRKMAGGRNLFHKEACKRWFRRKTHGRKPQIVFGKQLLAAIPNRKKTHLEIAQRTANRARFCVVVAADSLSSYKFVSVRASVTGWQPLQRDVSRKEKLFGEEVAVSVNACEGLFARVKTHFRWNVYSR